MRSDDSRPSPGSEPRTAAPEVEALRRALYAGAPDAAAVQRYRQLAASPHERSGAEPDAEAPASPEPRTASPDAAAAPPALPPRPRRRTLLVALVLTAFVVGLAGGGVLVAGIRPSFAATRAVTHPALAATAAAKADVATRAAGALAIFELPQQDSDRPAELLTSQLIVPTFRRLEVIGNTGTSLYAAKNVDHEYCLVEANAMLGFSASCASETGFVASPLRLDFQVPSSQVDRSTEIETNGKIAFINVPSASDEVLAYWSVDAGVGWTYTHG